LDRAETFRQFFAHLITSYVGIKDPDHALRAALQSIRREDFLGPGPWKISTPAGYILTPSDDPAFIYQDVAVALDAERHVNNGQPTVQALCLVAVNPAQGESVVHIGAGTGYYTAVLARLVGPRGKVAGYEIDQNFARLAASNLRSMSNVIVHAESGAAGSSLPPCDIIYVNAAATGPLDAWMDALKPGGRILFPLTPADVDGKPGLGAMLLLTRVSPDQFKARFICPASFVPCLGARDQETAARLTAAFKRGNHKQVRSLRRKAPADDTCWFAGNGWWLSTDAPATPE
jgi:protein-L-isoaspartate(D-aspartate) O-methyltransferase